LGDPLNLRMSGVTINQPDLPHWAVDVLNWLGMVQAMQSAYGDVGKRYRERLKMVFDYGEPCQYTNDRTGKSVWLTGPAAVYGLYQSFVAAIEKEASK
jgi:hypothetical protein